MASFETYQTVAGSGVSQALPTALTTVGGIRLERVRIYVETAPIRFTLDGTTPVAATTGELANPGDVLELFGGEVQDFLFINEGGVNASLKCHGARGRPVGD